MSNIRYINPCLSPEEIIRRGLKVANSTKHPVAIETNGVGITINPGVSENSIFRIYRALSGYPQLKVSRFQKIKTTVLNFFSPK